MGTWDYSRLKAELLFRFASRDDLESPTDWAGRFINDAYLTLCTKNHFWTLKRRFDFPELETSTTANTVDGTAYITTPTDAFIIRHLHNDTDDVAMRPMGVLDYQNKPDRADTTAEDAPTSWVRMGTKLYLYPTPDAVYTIGIHYRKRPALLTAATDVTVLSPEWDEAIVSLAEVQTHMRFHDYDKAEKSKGEWLDYVAGILGAVNISQEDSRNYLQPDPSYRGGGYGG
jgi:hypothetical protein